MSTVVNTTNWAEAPGFTTTNFVVDTHELLAALELKEPTAESLTTVAQEAAELYKRLQASN
jgi:hypothetical protein